MKQRKSKVILLCFGMILAFMLISNAGQLKNVLVYSACGTNGSAGACHAWLYDDGENMMKNIAAQAGFVVDCVRDALPFTDNGLKNYDVVVFNNVGNNPLTASQQAAFIRYIYNGGGYIGWHASDANHGTWFWYTDTLLCADIQGHAGIRPLPVVKDSININNPCLTGMFPGITPNRSLPDTTLSDEWYTYIPDPTTRPSVKMLLWLIDAGKKKPMTWCQQFDKGGPQPGRMMYTNCGHQESFYTNSWFNQLILNSLRWVAKCDLTTDVNDNVLKSKIESITSLKKYFDNVKNGNAKIQIYNINGQQINLKSFITFNDLKNSLPFGCHIVKIIDLNGKVLAQAKIVK